MKKTSQLRHLLNHPELQFIMEAHNGMSAKIVEEAGFKGIWGSGLTISAAQGVRDNNELSWTQVVDVVEYMSDATRIPILLDGDTGYGNFNNMRRLVKKLEQIQVAGVCIEDKIFPKTNSFLRDGKQPLADIDEFCGKIKAGKDSQIDDDFVIVARLEAFIAGRGLREALTRAEHYHQAGADAILVHSKLSTPKEIFEFTQEWANRSPVIIVPTKYYSTPTDAFRQHDISLVIWANHLMRGAVNKMQEIAKKIYTEQNLHTVEDEVVSVSEIFRLQGDTELEEAEKMYLKANLRMREFSAVILAATQGKELEHLTEDIPKALIAIGGESIIEKSIKTIKNCGIQDITVVAGYKKEKMKFPGIHVVENPNFQTTGQLASLASAIGNIKGDTVVSFGDILFKKYILNVLLDDEADIVIAVDALLSRKTAGKKSDYVYCTQQSDMHPFDNPVYLKEMRFAEPNPQFNGEWIGMLKLSEKGTQIIKAFIKDNCGTEEFANMHIPDMLNHLVKQGIEVKVQYIHGHWLDVDDIIDLSLANNF